MSVISRLDQLPVDIIGLIGLRWSAREFATLFQISKTIFQVLTAVHENIARNERARIRIEWDAIPLNAWQAAEQWGQLTPEEVRALKPGLRPMFYAGIIDPAMVLLKEKFLAVRNDQVALSNLALGHLDLRQAAILVSQISDKKIRATAMHTIVERAIDENLPESTILEFISNLVMEEMPLEKIKKTMKKIPGSAKKRDKELLALALKNGIKIGKAISIARLIQDPGNREFALCDIALKDNISLKHLVYIKGFIKDDYTLLALEVVIAKKILSRKKNEG
jgi:hypothetical protein